MKIFSIGIPTYNRKKIIEKNVKDILLDNFLQNNKIDLIVSDNKSWDGTYSLLKKIKKIHRNNENFIIQQNRKNLGVFKNIFKIFKSCNSKYLMITSDEEFISKTNIPKLIDFLEDYNPSFVSTQFYLNKRLYRGSKSIKKIPMWEWDISSFFTSGLVFNVKSVNLIISKYYNLLTKKNLYYVQSLIVAELMLMHPNTQWYFNFFLVEKKFHKRTEVSAFDDHQYWSLVGRYNSFLAIDSYFKARYLNNKSNKLIKEFIKKNRRSLYRRLVESLGITNPEMLIDFKYGVANVEFSPFTRIFYNIMIMRYKIKKFINKFKK